MSLPVQLYTMLAMIVMGSFFGAALDTYQRFLKRSKRKKVIVFINDVLFWVVQGLIIFYVLFLVNHGELRFYLALALLCGFSAYQALMKKYYLLILDYLINFIRSAAMFFYKLIQILVYRPTKGLILLVISLLLLIARIFLALVKAVMKVLLWVLKIILYPLLLIGKGIWKLLPAPVRKGIGQLRAWFLSNYIFLKDIISKGVLFIQNLFSKIR